MAGEVRLLGRRSAAFGFIVCLLAMTWACGPRTTPAAPVSPQPAPVAPPRSAPPAPEPSAPPAQPAPQPTPPALPPASAVPADRTDECALIAEPGEPVATVALTDRVDPANAPRPSNEGERVLFRQLFETLVRADCRGRVGSGLAASWQLEADGRGWVVTLREDARFSDGTPVTAADVRASWTRDGTEELRPQVNRLVESVAVAGDRALAITLRSRRQDAPLALAHSDLAIAKAVAGSPWPLGTRSSRIAPGAAPGLITVVRDTRAPIRFLIAAGDPRDLLDQGVDLLMTRDRAALDYAATLPPFQSVPLAWQRTHILMTPGRSRSAVPLSDEQRQVLAGDAVRGEARGARAPFWWQGVPDCEARSAPARTQSRSGAPPTPRVVYDANDAAARDLAERLVGLVRVSSPAATAFLDALLPDRPLRTYQRAAGLNGAALAQAMRVGADAGYVVAVDTQPVDPCRDLQILVEGARWLDPETIVPLVETRLRAVVRRGRSGAIVESDGGVLLAGESAPRR
jgi:hypothetical protein